MSCITESIAYTLITACRRRAQTAIRMRCTEFHSSFQLFCIQERICINALRTHCLSATLVNHSRQNAAVRRHERNPIDAAVASPLAAAADGLRRRLRRMSYSSRAARLGTLR